MIHPVTRVAAGCALVGLAGCSGGAPADSVDAGRDSTAAAPARQIVQTVFDATDPSVLQFHKHVNRDGFFVDGKLTEAKAGTFHKDTTFNSSFSGNVYASPLYVENGVSGAGTFYVATENATVYALDSTGATLWSSNVATAATASGAGCGNISPIGITGTPAIDMTTRLMVFDAASADSSGDIKTHTVYGISIDTGAVSWSVDVSTLTTPGGLKFRPQQQNQRGAVLIVNGVAYIGYGGHDGDCGTYHGWVVGVPLTGSGAIAWATQVAGAGIWGAGGPASDGTSIFVTTGNGFDKSTTWAESEGLFRFDPGPTFTRSAANFFAPYDWYSLDGTDLDLSGSGPLVIDAPAITPSELVMAQGKDGYLYLVKRGHLGGIATSSELANVGALKVQSGEISNAGAWATISGTTYVAVRPNGTNAAVGCPIGSGDLIVVKLDPAAPQKITPVWCADSGGVGSPSISSSDGTADPMLWIFGASSGTNKLQAFDLPSGKVIFGGGGSSDTSPNVRRFTTPIVVHGRVFVAGDGHLYAYTN